MKMIAKEKNKLNDITNSIEWLKNLKSVFSYSPNIKKFYGDHNVMGVGKDPKLCADIISFFTKEGELVLDPMCGVGGTLFGASLVNRKALGIDLYDKCCEHYTALTEEKDMTKQDFKVGDSLTICRGIKDNSFDTIITDFPYGIQHAKRDMSSPFNMMSESDQDICGFSWDNFYSYIGRLGVELCRILKLEKYFVFFCGDRYIKGHYIPVGYEIVRKLEEWTDFVFKGVRIWEQPNVFRKVYGFWKCYVPVVNHWNIFIMRKK